MHWFRVDGQQSCKGHLSANSKYLFVMTMQIIVNCKVFFATSPTGWRCFVFVFFRM